MKNDNGELASWSLATQEAHNLLTLDLYQSQPYARTTVLYLDLYQSIIHISDDAIV
jgi:hypothetical protein